MISSTPAAAYEMCTEFCPSCDKPFKYKQAQMGSSTAEVQNTTTPSTKSKEVKLTKKRRKNLQAVESHYASVDSEGNRNYEEIDEDEDYDDTEEEEDEDINEVVPVEKDILSVTHVPFFENEVSADKKS